MKVHLAFETKVLAAFAAAAVAVAALAATSWKISQDAVEAALRVSRTHEMLNNLANARGDTLAVEASTQGYMISGDAARLAERDAMLSAREASMRRMGELAAGNVPQQERWKRLREAVDARLAMSGRAVMLRQTEGLEASRAYTTSALVRETRERVFNVLREMAQDESRLLLERNASQLRVRDIAVSTGALAALGLLALLGATYFLIRRQFSELARTQHAIREQNELLEERVQERTADLQAANRGLDSEISERQQAEHRIRTQLEHLSLLDQITRSTGERLDLKSIFQIVLGRLEDSLPVDFACVGLYDPVANTLRVNSVGARSQALARELTLHEQAVIAIDANGLSRCVQGQLVYEPDIGQLLFPFPERLARSGLASLVLAPLKSESRVFGVLIVARRQAQAFSSTECEFLRQLSEHVALAAHQAQLYGSLQQAYDELRQTQAAAMQEERLRALGQMASGIAHDINNALSPVLLYTESMLESERNLSERARGYLQTIQRAVEDVAQTVARMREFYRQREQQLVLAPVDLNQLVQQVLDLTKARWSDQPMQSGIVIQTRTELAPGLPKIMGVESEIREALTNLVFNAVDAMPEGGTLTLRTRLDGAEPQQSVIVEVVDAGTGMDEDTRRRCLEPFFTTKGERGTGLGLAMVFGMVQRHSAGIGIASAPGAGTTVRLLFAVPAVVQTEPGQPAALDVPTALRLLLIDDDPVLLKSLQDTLQGDGHVIVAASGGQAGIEAFRAALGGRDPFAAVITDLGMPYVDGRRVALAIKQASPATPVILLTGWGQRMVAEGDIPPHVDRVLAKPPRLREVREALAQLCRQPHPPEAIA